MAEQLGRETVIVASEILCPGSFGGSEQTIESLGFLAAVVEGMADWWRCPEFRECNTEDFYYEDQTLKFREALEPLK